MTTLRLEWQAENNMTGWERAIVGPYTLWAGTGETIRMPGYQWLVDVGDDTLKKGQGDSLEAAKLAAESALEPLIEKMVIQLGGHVLWDHMDLLSLRAGQRPAPPAFLRAVTWQFTYDDDGLMPTGGAALWGEYNLIVYQAGGSYGWRVSRTGYRGIFAGSESTLSAACLKAESQALESHQKQGGGPAEVPPHTAARQDADQQIAAMGGFGVNQRTPPHIARQPLSHMPPHPVPGVYRPDQGRPLGTSFANPWRHFDNEKPAEAGMLIELQRFGLEALPMQIVWLGGFNPVANDAEYTGFWRHTLDDAGQPAYGPRHQPGRREFVSDKIDPAPSFKGFVRESIDLGPLPPVRWCAVCLRAEHDSWHFHPANPGYHVFVAVEPGAPPCHDEPYVAKACQPQPPAAGLREAIHNTVSADPRWQSILTAPKGKDAIILMTDGNEIPAYHDLAGGGWYSDMGHGAPPIDPQQMAGYWRPIEDAPQAEPAADPDGWRLYSAERPEDGQEIEIQTDRGQRVRGQWFSRPEGRGLLAEVPDTTNPPTLSEGETIIKWRPAPGTSPVKHVGQAGSGTCGCDPCSAFDGYCEQRVEALIEAAQEVSGWLDTMRPIGESLYTRIRNLRAALMRLERMPYGE